ncbi:hypothetical protein [Pseudomonas gingeri]|uniref:Uncharacterized protein n=1 Tax=Pseudomonas gingeri TaxID=117681 RepID=A0A7Y8BMX0_9PSED|nr:hypothetical protein [Pseudomonas gingeri]NWB49542.1 hypothetical protein [Pseudomonas gingeri]
MSGLHETIATLSGNLNFLVDVSGLQRFENSLAQVSKRMTALSTQADKLAAKLTGISPKSTTQKVDTSLEQSQGRQLKLQTALSNAQRQTFAAELHQGKLKFAGMKEEAFLGTQSLRHKQQAAIYEAKALRVEQEQLKAQGIQLKNQHTVEQAKLRQSRLEEILRTQQAKTLLLQEKQVAALSATQKAELMLTQARERGHQATERYQQRIADRRARELKSEEASARSAAKFKWAEGRQAVWQAHQNTLAPVSESGGLGMIGVLGGIAAAVYAISAAASMLSERVEHRQESTANTQQFDFALMSASEDPKVRDTLNKRYKETFTDYGMEIDTESARQYNNSSASLMKHGFSPEKAADTLDDRYAAFRIGNVSDANQKRIALHLDHILAQGHATGQNTRPLMAELGGKISQDVYVGTAHALGYKGKDEKAQEYFYKEQKAGKLTADAFYAGIHQAVINNPEVLARHKGSIEAQEARLKNDKFLQTDNIQKDPELVGAIGDRIRAERELVAAMAPVNNTLKDFDKALTQFQTGLLRTLVGKNFDGTVQDSAQRAADVASVGTVEGPAIDPSALTGKIVGSDRDNIHDPVDAFWKWLFNADQDKDKVGPANSLKVQAPDPFSPVPTLDTSQFGASRLPTRLEDLIQTPLLKGLVGMAVTDADRNPAATGVMSSSDAFYKASQQSSVTNNNNTTNNITNAPVTSVTVNANTNADAHEIAEHARNAVHSELKDVFSISNTAIGTKAQ